MCDRKQIEALIDKLDKFNPEQSPDIVRKLTACGEPAINRLFEAFFARGKTSEKEYILKAIAALVNEDELIAWLLQYMDRLGEFTRYYSLIYLFEKDDEAIREKLIPHMVEDIGGHYYCDVFARDTLPKCGEKALDSVISAFLDACKDQSENYHRRLSSLILILRLFEDDRIIEPLVSSLYAIRNDSLFQSLYWTLGELGRKAVPVILNAIQDEELSVEGKRCAVNSLARIPDKRSLDVLIPLLEHEDINLRRSAVAALGMIRDTKAMPHLIHILQTEENDSVRNATAVALGDNKDNQAVSALIKAMKTDPSSEVRRLAAHALRHYRGDDVIEALIEALHDKEEIVPIWARYALDEMIDEARPLLQKMHKEQPELIDRAFNTWNWDFVNDCRKNIQLQESQNPSQEDYVPDGANWWGGKGGLASVMIAIYRSIFS